MPQGSVCAVWLFIFITGLTYLRHITCGTIAQSVEDTIERQKRPYGGCGRGLLRCGTRECIEEEKLCDGKEDCIDGSDEDDCASIPCHNPFLFRCDYGACISKRQACDGKKDCRDNSDEKRCRKLYANSMSPGKINKRKCGSHFMKCNSGECLGQHLFCDGIEHCQDGSDESIMCTLMTCDDQTQFRCAYGACVNKEYRCDGIKDCQDNSDEMNCSQPDFFATSTRKPNSMNNDCGRNSLKCNSGECVPETCLCDGKVDCQDESDEEDCEYLPCITNPYLFRCAYGACINKQQVCDGNKDCKDNSDEVNCSNKNSCSANQFQCNSGECIDRVCICDGTADCLDNSDESETVCSHVRCPNDMFQCSYGACVSGNARCNGIKECFDGSDEIPCFIPKRCCRH